MVFATGLESVAASMLPRSARTIRVEEIRRDDFRRMKVLDLDGSSGAVSYTHLTLPTILLV